ncbi:hypothetical protein [Planktotalea sp.]|uniref:hypothetical protein n=1 Tax=Planktotalea sp. TaxID=2029877 RepID=UPI0035C7C898
MPIAECDGQSASHWEDVLSIVTRAADEAGFEGRLVSSTFESNLIHKEILQNIYDDDLIICDVSGRNPNVFFELGVRMATQKPTLIIKDKDTICPFDIGPNRYIEYPRDLRHPVMEVFKADLISAIEKTATHSKEMSFIGQLGPFQVPDVETTKQPALEMILDRMTSLEQSVINAPVSRGRSARVDRNRREIIRFRRMDDERADICIQGYSLTQVENTIDELKKRRINRSMDFSITERSPNHSHVKVTGERANSLKTLWRK